MKIEGKPPEKNAEGSVETSAIFVLEAENSNLRRLVVELLEKNQQLREQLRVVADGRNPGVAGDPSTWHGVKRGVDPRAA